MYCYVQYGFARPKMHIAMCNMDLDQKCILLCAILWICATKNEGWSWGEGATSCGVFGIGILYILTPRVSWNVFDQVCSFGLEVSNFFIAICMLRFFIAICILRRAICVQYAYCDAIYYFLLKKKGLEYMFILPKKFCNRGWLYVTRMNLYNLIFRMVILLYGI
jgi:hypothetical protein